ncbi:hypothetical protein B5K05_07370 [Rhizobium phaseoli]|nr:hypothetical protein B5K04_07330 [Rhizobium phaseoli]RDJ17669.1 hypothetical protein B5K05_07370 [Rhizobium phaseoli]
MTRGDQYALGRSTIDVWLRKRSWTYKKRPHIHWSRSVPKALWESRQVFIMFEQQECTNYFKSC